MEVFHTERLPQKSRYVCFILLEVNILDDISILYCETQKSMWIFESYTVKHKNPCGYLNPTQ